MFTVFSNNTVDIKHNRTTHSKLTQHCHRSEDKPWPTEGGGVFKPPEIPKVLQKRAKLNPVVKTVTNC